MSVHKTAAGPWGCSDLDTLSLFLGAGDDTNIGGRNRYHCAYIVYTDGIYFYAENGTTGKLVYGGPSSEGTVTGTDARDVIQAAVNAPGTSGGKVYIKSGVYTLDGAITLPNYIQIYGPYSRRSSEIGATAQAGAVLRLTDATNTNIFENANPSPTGNVGIEINGLYLHGGTQTAGNNINWSNVWRSVIRNCYVRNAETTTYISIYLREACEQNRIQNVVVEGGGITLSGSNAIYITDYEIGNPGRYGIEITGTNYGNVIQRGYVYGNTAGTRGIHVFNMQRGIISNNLVSDFDQDGINIARGMADSIITENTCYDNSQNPVNTHAGINIDSDTAATYLTGNIIANNRCYDTEAVLGNKTQAYGILFRSTGGADLTNENTVVDNSVFGNRTAGMAIGGGVGPDNIIKNNHGYNPVGVIANPFDTPNTRIEVTGAAATPTASTDYTICHMDVMVETADSGNTDAALVLKDSGGSAIWNTAVSPNAFPGNVFRFYAPRDFQLNWGAFTGAAPTVTIAFI